MRLVVLVPRRPDGGHRDRLWTFCRRYWERHSHEIVEGHDDGPLPFNRCAAVNRAAATAGDWDAAFICDSDLLVHPEHLVREAAEQAVDTGQLVYPYDRYLYVAEPHTMQILDHDTPVEQWNRTCIGFRFWVRHGYAMGCPIIPRRLWDDMGGFDERFIGWAPEDHAMNAVATTLGGDHIITPGGSLFHLWHPIDGRPTDDDPHYAESCALFRRYQAAKGDVAAIRTLIAEREVTVAR